MIKIVDEKIQTINDDAVERRKKIKPNQIDGGSIFDILRVELWKELKEELKK